jgi:N-acetylmuramoyl-L-alanine amidase
MYQRPLNEIKYIVIHHTASKETASVNDIRRIHKGLGYSDIGYHFLVDRKGNKFVGRDINFNGAHTVGEKSGAERQKRYKNIIDINHKGIGISLIGSYENHPPNNVMINETAYLIKKLCDKYSIPLNRDRVFGHKEVDYTACPGQNTMNLIYEKLGI